MSKEQIFINKALLPHFTRAIGELAINVSDVKTMDVAGHPDTIEIHLPKGIDQNSVFQLGMLTNSGYQLGQISDMLNAKKSKH
jgi:hypothetical protein